MPSYCISAHGSRFSVLQTERGIGQATKAGQRIREVLEADGAPYRLFFYTSPYKRSHQTYEAVASCFKVTHLFTLNPKPLNPKP